MTEKNSAGMKSSAAFHWCPRSDSNGDAHMGTGPQPAAYANSATGAQIVSIIRRVHVLVNLFIYPLQWFITI